MEEWKDIEGYNGMYQISNHGRVKSLPRRCSPNESILRQSKNIKGYLRVGLVKNNKLKNYLISRLVGIAFLEKNEGREEINHIDGNPLNNNVSNLEWTDRSENMLHAVRTGLLVHAKGSKNGKSKLTEEDVKKIRTMPGPNREIAAMFNINISGISLIKNRKTWKHVI